MPPTYLAASTVGRTNIGSMYPSVAADTVNGNSFDSDCFLAIRSSSGSDLAATFSYAPRPDGLVIPARSFTIVAGSTSLLGPWPSEEYGQDDDLQRVYVNSASASLLFRPIRFPVCGPGVDTSGPLDPAPVGIEVPVTTIRREVHADTQMGPGGTIPSNARIYFENDGRTFLVVRGGSGTGTQTIRFGRGLDGQTPVHRVISSALNMLQFFGPFPPNIYNQAADARRVYVDLDTNAQTFAYKAIRILER